MRILRPPNKSMAYDAIDWKIERYLKRYFCWFSRLRKCPTRRISRWNHINWLWTSINKALSVSLFKEEKKKQPRKFYSFILTCWFFHLFFSSLHFFRTLTHSLVLTYLPRDWRCLQWEYRFFCSHFSQRFFSLYSRVYLVTKWMWATLIRFTLWILQLAYWRLAFALSSTVCVREKPNWHSQKWYWT